MRFLGVLLFVSTGLPAAGAQSETYFGLLDGIHALTLQLDRGEDQGAVRLEFPGDEETYVFRGGCTPEAEQCRFRARDTALLLELRWLPNQLSGQLIDARQRARRLSGVRASSPLAAQLSLDSAGCRGSYDLVSYANADSTLQLTVAELPAGAALDAAKGELPDLFARELRGTLYDGRDSTTYRVRGRYAQGRGRLELSRIGGGFVGNLLLEGIPASHERTARLKLIRDAVTFDTELTPVERLPLGCRSTAGRFAMLYLRGGFSPAAQSLADRQADRRWERMQELRPGGEGYAWVEPARLTQQWMSAWVYGPEGLGDLIDNIDRETGRRLRTNGLEGNRATRVAHRSAAYEKARGRHPLYGEADYEAWSADLRFEDFVILHEGLGYTSDYHPVYGRLMYVEPYTELIGPQRSGRLPAWLSRMLDQIGIKP